jgi:hypothetical protein
MDRMNYHLQLVYRIAEGISWLPISNKKLPQVPNQQLSFEVLQ